MSTVEGILEQALRLSHEERERVVAELIQSMEPPESDLSEEEWLAAWLPELERRSAAYHRGETAAVPWQEATARVRATLKRMREP